MHIFIDESGDLGNKNLDRPNRSKYFVLAGLCCDNPKKIAKCVVKTRDTLKGKDIPELKFAKSTPETRRRMIENLAEVELDICAIVVDKTTVFPTLMDKKEIYFNWVSGYLIRKLISKFPDGEDISVVIDRRSFGKNREEFDNYIDYKIKTIFGDRWILNISHKKSEDELCLQAIDFIAGAIHAKYRYNDSFLFEKIKHKLTIEEIHRKIENSEAP